MCIWEVNVTGLGPFSNQLHQHHWIPLSRYLRLSDCGRIFILESRHAGELLPLCPAEKCLQGGVQVLHHHSWLKTLLNTIIPECHVLKKKDFIKKCYNGPILKHLLKIKQITVFKLFSMNKYDNNMHLVLFVSCFLCIQQVLLLIFVTIKPSCFPSLDEAPSSSFFIHYLNGALLFWAESALYLFLLNPPLYCYRFSRPVLQLSLFGCYTGDMAVRIPLHIVCVCKCVKRPSLLTREQEV